MNKLNANSILAGCVAFALWVSIAPGLQAQSPQMRIPAQLTTAVNPAVEMAAATAAVNANLVQASGKIYPKTASASCCQLGETRSRDVLFFTMFTGKNEAKNKQFGPFNAVEGVDTCWMITNYQRVDKSAAGKFMTTVSSQPAGFHFVSSSEYTNEYNAAHNYLLSLNLPKSLEASLEVKLSDIVKNYSSAAQSIDTNRAVVQQGVTLWGAGAFNGRSWYDGYVNITETCCPPEIRDSAALKKMLKTWIDSTRKTYFDRLPTSARFNFADDIKVVQ